ncbi:iron-sulfur cluster repair di-iron protein [Austwickia chelonae]|uniref:iron-sulfur cluster repair di-iron protein n=1 Tax=Austwickia chelonae TaxID=100225 RepID=UPI000E26FAAE|nr:iron-sulfur cluster repair di-iron protein [Austwickia chelonae]
MPVDPTATLGTLVTDDPRRSRVLEEQGLDYCCNGGRSLEEACAAAELDPVQIAALLDLPDPEPAPAWQSFGIAELAQHILLVHHQYLWDEMPRLGELVDKVVRVHGENHPELAQVGADYAALVADLSSHLTKEERILFPAIIALGTPGAPAPLGCGLRGPITQMMYEHDVAGDLLRSIRATTQDYTLPEDACGSYRMMFSRLEQMEADLHEHIHKENNVLFPRVLEMEEA